MVLWSNGGLDSRFRGNDGKLAPECLGCVDIYDISRPQSQTVIPAKAGIQTPAPHVSTVINTPVRAGRRRTMVLWSNGGLDSRFRGNDGKLAPECLGCVDIYDISRPAIPNRHSRESGNPNPGAPRLNCH